jgi:microsomal dipeptidase-like Zn-dependent dipeptidase
MQNEAPAAISERQSGRRGGGRAASRLLWIVALLVLTAASCDHDGPGPPESPPLVGLAEFHNHEFGNLGFGGYVISHSPDPAEGCRPILPFASDGNKVKDIVRKQMFAEAATQAADGKCYPTATSWVGQRVDTENLKRAWQYGLRLLVMLAVSNEYLCQVGGLGENPALDDPINHCPTDRVAIDAQLQAAKDLEAQIDTNSGGPGMGWYRIVRTPAEARQVIQAGKLAVVLGVEAVNAFGCKIVARDVVEGVPNLGGEKPEEQTYQNFCDPAPASGRGSQADRQNYRTQKALALFEHYWQLGVRHFFPIHNMDGTAGGAAAYIPVLHSEMNPTRQANADVLDRVADTNRVIIAIRPPYQTTSCPGVEFDQPSPTAPGRCNVLGLTDTGRHLIRMMASYGAVIDIDHMSRKAKNEVLASDGLLGGVYPFVSSHSGALAIGHGDASNEGRLSDQDFASMIPTGGAFAPVLPPASSTREEDTYPSDATVAKHECGGTSESFVQAYRYYVDKLRSIKLVNGKDAFVGVGFGTDYTAPGSGGPAPRFEESRGPVTTPLNGWFPWTVATGGSLLGAPGRCYLTSDPNAPRRVQYPFKSSSPDPNQPTIDFDKSNVSWTGMRADPYDISLDGMVHIGMIPDFVEELRTLGLTSQDLDPLWHGAEAYIREWESASSWQGNFNDEDNKGIQTACSDLRAELLSAATGAETITALDALKAKGCLGFPTP